MHIICTTTIHASEVLFLLLDAGMGLRRDFTIQPVLSTTPPITFIMLVNVPDALMQNLRAVPDTTLTG